MTENTTTAADALAVEEGQALPCFVRHLDAGGQCWEPATVRVYGIGFCEAHGEEVKLGALMEEHEDAAHFFERFRNPHVPDLNGRLVERELAAVVARFIRESPTDEDYWILDERPGYAPVVDTLLDTLSTLHRLLRAAHEEGEAWLVEIIEQER